MSAYSDHAASYLENGLSVMPCAPGTKFPGTYSSADGWRAAYDWQKYAQRRPTDYETRIWDRWPDAGICLALGAASGHGDLHLVAIDIDTDEPAEVAAIRAAVPGSPCVKRGAKGETQFYLAPASVKSQPYNDANKRRMLDLLCAGRQTVMPPTVHPDTGAPYHWLSPDTLDDFAVKDLPVLPEDIALQIGDALKPFGYEAPPERPAEGERGEAVAGSHRALNDAALANLPAWVPSLQLHNCRQVGGNYKAVAHWRPSSSGRPLSKRATNLIISADGIRDKGDEKGYTPLDLVMAACGTDLDTAFRWLQERVAPQPVVVLRAAPRPEPEAPPPEAVEVNTPARNNLAGLRLIARDGEVVPATSLIDDDEDDGDASTTVIPPEVCTPPGLIGDIVAFMNSCSPVPSPQLNLSVTLAFLGAVYGRRFESPTRARTNFYNIGLARSGFGKSYPLECLDGIERAASLDRFFGPAELKSDSALRNLLKQKNPVLLPVDEVGESFGKMLDRNAQAHQSGLRRLLLDFFSSAKGTYRGSEGAAEQAVRIENPHLCLAGMSTPTAWWRAFNSVNAENGLLPRILIFDAGTTPPKKVKPTCEPDDVPDSIRKALHAALDARPVGNLAAIDPTRKVKPIRAEWGDGAEDMFDGIRDWAEGLQNSADGLVELAYSRFAEHVIKLALVYAVSIDPASPVITTAGLSWSREVVECTTRALLKGAVDRIADNEAQADYKRVLRIIKEAGPWGISTKALIKTLAGSLTKRVFDDIVEQLRAAGEIEKYVGSGAKGGKPTERVRAVVDMAEAG